MTGRARLFGLDAPERRELTGADGKDLALSAALTIYIGGPGEDGEPEVADCCRVSALLCPAGPPGRPHRPWGA